MGKPIYTDEEVVKFRLYAERCEFASRCLREPADKDYMAARAVFRLGLWEQFAWLASQTVEKYLKAILVFEEEDIHSLSHNITDAWKKVLAIKGINFDFPGEVGKSVNLLESAGAGSRYLDHPIWVDDSYLARLDEAVWFIRRYCRPLRGPLATGLTWSLCPEGRDPEIFAKTIRRIQSDYFLRNPYKVRVDSRSALEKVLDGEKSAPLRKALVWNNQYFGTRKKKARVRRFVHIVNPPHYLHPEIYTNLEKTVKFPKSVRIALGQPTGASRK